jgi:hypothetical protein
MRQVTTILIKRKHIDPKGSDQYGHWWFEIHLPASLSESYGWWPAQRLGEGLTGSPAWQFLWALTRTLLGVEGDLNGVKSFGGSPTLDAHHGDPAEDQFHPLDAHGRTDHEIAECLRKFAQAYNGRWRWTFGFGQNCHTFQKQALKHCRLLEPSRSKA